jgi:protein-tyrosine phosphatase
VVVSLLTRGEQSDLELEEEARLCQAIGIGFVSTPITDRGVPSSVEAFADQASSLIEQLSAGKNVAIHCRQGIGRAALVAICLLTLAGVEPHAAIERVAASRGCTVPETLGSGAKIFYQATRAE